MRLNKRVYEAGKALSVIIAAVCAVRVCFITADSDEITPPRTSAYSYCLYCPNNGEFICGENDEQQLPMASTTKIMTALLGIEAYQSGQVTQVTMSSQWYAEGSSMYLADGETVSMDDLVGGMLMVSGNDAANAIACSVAGSIEDFADLMNSRADELELNDTHFVTPSGLDAEGHFTTARDLARLMAACMENEEFARIDSQGSVTVDFIIPEGKTQTYYNENKLLKTVEGCVSGKTGYTDKAGRTLVSCAERGGIRLIAVTLNDPDDWNDHAALYEYGFGKLKMTSPMRNGETLKVDVVGGQKASVDVEFGDPPQIVAGSAEQTREYDLPPFVYAPVKKGDRLGEVRYYTGGVCAGSSEITAAEDINADSCTTSFLENILSWLRAISKFCREKN